MLHGCHQWWHDLKDFVFLFAYLPCIISLHFSVHFLNDIYKVKEKSASKLSVKVKCKELAVVDRTLA